MTDPIDQKARECAEKCAYHGQYGCDVSIFTPIIAAAMREVCEPWKKNYYYDVADAICRESTSTEDLCKQARAIRAERDTLRAEATRLAVEVERLKTERAEWAVLYRRDYGHDWDKRVGYEGF